MISHGMVYESRADSKRCNVFVQRGRHPKKVKDRVHSPFISMKLLASRNHTALRVSPAVTRLTVTAGFKFLGVGEVGLAGPADTWHWEDGGAMRGALPTWGAFFLSASGLNQDKGVAPWTTAVLRELETKRLSLPGSVRPAARRIVADARARVSAAAFRKR